MRNIVVWLAVLVFSFGSAQGVTVSVNPDPPQAGQNLTITYDPAGGPLAGALSVSLHHGYNGWHPVISPDPVMTLNGSVWEVTVAVPSQATQINMSFHTAGIPDVWDNNGGWNWAFTVTGGEPNAGVTVTPDPVQAGQNVTVSYDPVGGPLAAASTVLLHYGVNVWNPTNATDVPMTLNAGKWEATVPVKSYAYEFDAAFTDGGTPTPIWDTNSNGFDWRFPVSGTIPGVQVSPDPPVAGQPVTITYNPQDTPLAGATAVYLHYGINDFNPTYDNPDVLMTSNGPVWEATVPALSIHACELNFVFNDGAGTWDNNSGNDWNYATTGCVPLVSELDKLYVAKVLDLYDSTYDTLYIGVAGNLQNNGSAMVIFIDTPGRTGQTELKVDGVAQPPDLLPLASAQNDLLSCGTVGTGTILPGEADYALYLNYSGRDVHFNEYQLYSTAASTVTCCDGVSTIDVLATQVYAGSTRVNDANTIFEVDQGLGYVGGFDDSNTSGVPANVNTGLEIGIPMANLGLLRTDTVKVFVAILPNNSGVQGQFSNQTLPPSDDLAGYCSPAQMFPLRADMTGYSAFFSAGVASLPNFTGLADGVINAADYGGSANATQTCAVAAPVADTTATLSGAPVQGQPVTVFFDPTGGPLAGVSPVYLHYGYDGWNPTIAPDVAMISTNGTGWKATVTMAATALLLDLNFNNGSGTNDDNNGQNWHFEIGRPAAGATVVINPNPAVAGQNVTITYDPTGRPLAGANPVYLHYGFNGWSPTISPDPAMTRNVNCKWEITVPVAAFASGAQGLNLVFNDGAGTWDNNGGADWHFQVDNQAGPPPWTMDGNLDPCAKLVGTSSSGTRHLYAGMRGGFLYVATERSQANNDHFILVAATPNPGAQVGAPWAKAGTVAQWDAYLAQESTNGWNGWFDMGAGTNRSNGPQSMTLPYLEGQFDVFAELGFVPATISLAMGAWGTNNGNPLVPAMQIATGNGDGNIDAAEYLSVSMASIDVLLNADPADFNVDCDVDLGDYADFINCMSPLGPNTPKAGTCPVGVDADFDNDNDVDLRDFRVFQDAFTG